MCAEAAGAGRWLWGLWRGPRLIKSDRGRWSRIRKGTAHFPVETSFPPGTSAVEAVALVTASPSAEGTGADFRALFLVRSSERSLLCPQRSAVTGSSTVPCSVRPVVRTGPGVGDTGTAWRTRGGPRTLSFHIKPLRFGRRTLLACPLLVFFPSARFTRKSHRIMGSVPYPRVLLWDWRVLEMWRR